MKRAVALPGLVKFLNSCLHVGNLLPQVIVFFTLELKLFVLLLVLGFKLLKLDAEEDLLVVGPLEDGLDPVDFTLTLINMNLFLFDFLLVELVNLFLTLGHIVQLFAHILDLLRGCMVNVGLSRDLLVAVLNFFLGVLVLVSHLAQVLLGLGQLNLNVTKGVLELLVLNLAQTEHLSVLDLCALLAFHSQASSCRHSFHLKVAEKFDRGTV